MPLKGLFELQGRFIMSYTFLMFEGLFVIREVDQVGYQGQHFNFERSFWLSKKALKGRFDLQRRFIYLFNCLRALGSIAK